MYTRPPTKTAPHFHLYHYTITSSTACALSNMLFWKKLRHHRKHQKGTIEASFPSRSVHCHRAGRRRGKEATAALLLVLVSPCSLLFPFVPTSVLLLGRVCCYCVPDALLVVCRWHCTLIGWVGGWQQHLQHQPWDTRPGPAGLRSSLEAAEPERRA